MLDFWKAESDAAHAAAVLHPRRRLGHRRQGSGATVSKEYLRPASPWCPINYRFSRKPRSRGGEAAGGVAAARRRARAAIRPQQGRASGTSTKRASAPSGGSAGACSSLWLAFHDDLADPKSSRSRGARIDAAVVRRRDGAQTTLDPQQMKEWTPNSRYGGHAFGFMPDPKRHEDSRHAVRRVPRRRASKILPWIKEYSPYELVTRRRSADLPDLLRAARSRPGAERPDAHGELRREAAGETAASASSANWSIPARPT